MSEEEIFKILVSLDPDSGKKNRIIINNEDKIILPEWTKVKPKRKLINTKIENITVNSQILYDIFVLGLTDISQRPKCPICGKPCKYSNFNRGYSKTCGNEMCTNQSIKNTVTNLWENEEYRNMQSESHKLWASKQS